MELNEARKQVSTGTALFGMALLLAAAPTLTQELPATLSDTGWRLVEFQSMDDAIGTTAPQDSSLYTLRLMNDGSVALRLNCNRAFGTWSAEAGPDGQSGSFEFGPLATTMALCPPPSIDELIARQTGFVRGFLLRDGRLYLSLFADAGVLAFEPDPAAAVPAHPDDGGPEIFAVSVTGTLNLRAEPSVGSEILASLRPGERVDNLGCELGPEYVWCYVQSSGGGPVGYAAAAYLTPAT